VCVCVCVYVCVCAFFRDSFRVLFDKIASVYFI